MKRRYTNQLLLCGGWASLCWEGLEVTPRKPVRFSSLGSGVVLLGEVSWSEIGTTYVDEVFIFLHREDTKPVAVKRFSRAIMCFNGSINVTEHHNE